MKILAIETSCDETALSIVNATGPIKSPKFKVVASEIASQINIHRPFGGVVPNLAKREHEINLPILLEQLKTKNLKLKTIDLVAVTVGPGLEPALWAGIEFAKNLAREYNKPIIGVNHLEGHLYSFLLPKKTGIMNDELRISNSKFPLIALLVSGGHTVLLKLSSMTKWKKLGETLDDAVGEAFDKVARLLELPYPGGPEIEKLAKEGKPIIPFPRPMLHQKNYDFSFSGLKTSVLYYLRDHFPLKRGEAADVAASFQQAAVDVLVKKTMRAVEEFGARAVIVAGGVASNKFLRDTLKKEAAKAGAEFFCPQFGYNTDNATMIAAAGYINYLRKRKLPIKANGNLGI